MILGVWLYGLVMAFPVFYNRDSYGYNRRSGMCDFLDTGRLTVSYDSATVEKTAVWFVGFNLPLYIMLVSYFTIWKFVRKSTSFLKENTQYV